MLANYSGRDLDDCWENGVNAETLAFRMGQHCAKSIADAGSLRIHAQLHESLRDAFRRGHNSVRIPKPIAA